MRVKVLALCGVGCFYGWAQQAMAQATVQGVRVWDAPGASRVVLDLAAPVTFKVFTLSQPARVVIDIEQGELRAEPPKIAGQGVITSLRTGTHSEYGLRFVLDLAQTVTPKGFLLPPNDIYGHRLVVDLEYTPSTHVEQPPIARPPTTSNTKKPGAPTKLEKRDIVIAVDAGHGGEDPGAHGRKGTREKDVVLAIAKRLAQRIDREPGMKAVLTRDGDYFLSLRRRARLARQAKADLFVSVHADAFRNPNASGSSVWVLSQRGATDEAARWLADRENQADLVGGVSLDDKDDVLASVLLDLSLTGIIDASTRVAQHVLNNISAVGAVHKPAVQYAGFVVLKSPDVPSILVETAFISNKKEEARLRDQRFQQQIAEAIMQGIFRYFKANPPPGTQWASRPVVDEKSVAVSFSEVH